MRGEQLNLFDTKYTKIDDLVNESFWAYHAGMADGDGCITTGKERKKEYLRYRLKLCDKNIIEEIANLYKVTITEEKKKKKHHKQLYVCSLYSSNARHFISNIAPYLIEKKKFAADLCKKFNIEVKKADIDFDSRFVWLAGYFDAEGSVKMNPIFRRDTENYVFDYRVKFTSTNLFVLRFIRKLLNKTFNKGNSKSIFNIYLKPDKRPQTKPCYEIILRRIITIFIFGKCILPFIKIKRKIDKFKKIINYGRFAANQKWQFGHINFKKNTSMRERWLRASEVE